jgi:predicted nucleic acid-binding protein
MTTSALGSSPAANAFRRISSLSSDPPPYRRHDPARHTSTLAYRRNAELPYDLTALAPEAVLMLDTTVYIDAQQAKLPKDLAARIAGGEILHSAVALGEIAANLGLLDPGHAGTSSVTPALLDTLGNADPPRILPPSAEAWLEASVMAGILARTQHLPRESRRKLLNDALVFLGAAEAGAVLVSRNSKDMDLLLQLRADARVLLYVREA